VKAVQLLLNSYLPEEFRNYEREYTKKEIMGILAGIAEKYPDKYADTIAKIAKAGRENSYLQGETLGLEDMKPTFDKQPILDEMHKKVKATKLIRDPEKQKTARMAVYMDTLNKLHKETMSSSMQKKTTLANSVLSGARGNPTQLRSMITSPGLYADYKDNPIDLFVENSYGEGLRPADYLASTFGARKSVIATKACYHIDTQVLKIVNGILYEVAIKDIKVGDTIMGADREGNSFPTKVKAVYDQGLQDVYEWILYGNICEKSVWCTEDHKFSTDQGIKTIKDIHAKELAIRFLKNNNVEYCYVKNTSLLGQLPCIDIEVDSPDHLFVLANGLIGSNSTADAGFLGKQMGFSSADLVVTEEDSGSSHGIKLSTDHLGDLKGRVLARPVGPFNAGTVIDKQVLAEINKKKIPFVLVKSPLTSYTKQGIDAQSIGMMPDKRFARIGDAVGLTASSASSEPVIQGSLGTKHLSGAVKGQKMQFSGFNVINQMMQAPKTFPNKAVLAELDGFVEKVEEAPQGGYYIHIGGEKHYTGLGVEPLVKAGQEVEAGEQLADGLIDPKDILRLRGIGEARKYYVDRLRQIYDDSGIPVERINLELLARNAINHITLEDNTDYPDIIPDTVISYNEFASRYKPAEDSKELRPTKAVGTYLQSPALHYTIGTRVTPKIAKELEETGYDSVYASPKEPPFKPLFSRLMTANENQEDWFGRLHGSHLTKNLQTAAEQGQDTNILSNTHFAPRFAYGKDFGKTLTTTGKY